jgi:hypothetical protein
LTQHFGALDEASRERLAMSTPEQRAVWAERLLDAPSLEELLG